MKDWLDLEKKIVIITGASSGIGENIAKTILQLGAIVINFDITTPNLKNENYYYYKVDVSNRENIEMAMKEVIDKFSRIDALINNAGIALPGMLVDGTGNKEYLLTEELFDKIYSINQKGNFLMTQCAANYMVKQRKGVILNISTESTHEGSIGQAFYVATKSAINSMTTTFAKELGKYNIRVLAIAPGIMEKTALRSERYEKALAYIRGIDVHKLNDNYQNKAIPLQRSGKLQEISDVCAFYISDRASYMTGIITNVAGGKSRG